MFVLDEWTKGALENFEVAASGSEYVHAWSLHCLACDSEVTTINPGDSLSLIVAEASDHICPDKQIEQIKTLFSTSLDTTQEHT